MTPEEALKAVPLDLWVGGVQAPAASGKRFAVHNPATGEVLAEVADAGPEDGARALDEAVKAQAEWAATPSRKRAEILRRAWELVDGKYRDNLAMLMTLEMGKPLAESNGEVTYGGEFLRWFAEEAPRINGRYTPS